MVTTHTSAVTLGILCDMSGCTVLHTATAVTFGQPIEHVDKQIVPCQRLFCLTRHQASKAPAEFVRSFHAAAHCHFGAAHAMHMSVRTTVSCAVSTFLLLANYVMHPEVLLAIPVMLSLLLCTSNWCLYECPKHTAVRPAATVAGTTM